MDSYSSYVCPSDFETDRTPHSNAPIDESKPFLDQNQQQQLPPFRELLGTGAQRAIEPVAAGASMYSTQGNTMTRRTFQPALGPLKIEPSTPEGLHTGSSLDNFDSMSAQSGDSAYPAQRHHRQNSSWTSTSHYNELVSPYSSQQRAACAIQTHFPQPKAEPSLPSIHYLTDNAGYPSAPYAYGPTGGAYNDHRNYAVKAEPSYPLKSETASYYEAPNRYGQHHPQVNRSHPTTMDYQRYPSVMFDYPKGYCPSPYSVEYLPSPTSSHHPVSPTVSNGDGCGIGGGRRRRGNLPKQITDYLKGWFMEHLDHPYPTEEEKQVLVHETHLTIAQISNWFINARRRHLPAWRHQRQEANRRASQNPSAKYDPEQIRRSHKSFD